MRDIRRTFLYGFIIGMLAICSNVQAARLVLLAVRVNDVAITPTSDLTIEPGDKVEVNFFGSEWSPEGQRLKLFQMRLDVSGYTSDGGGSVEPLNFLAIPSNLRTEGAFIDSIRPDFVFADIFQLALCATDTATSSYRYGCAAQAATILLPVYEAGDTPKYMGTVILQASADACGTFTINFAPSIRDGGFGIVAFTDFYDQLNIPILPMELVPLNLTISKLCGCPLSVDQANTRIISNPPNCAIDARQPSDSFSATWRNIHLPFQSTISCATPDRANFSLVEFPQTNESTSNAIVDVAASGETTMVSILLHRAIRPGGWTCINYSGIDQGRACLGSLPGDVNNDGIVLTSDITHLMGSLSGEKSLKRFQCDTNHSGSCSPHDLLQLIDLMNGAGNSDSWWGVEIADGLACPSLP